MAKRASGGHPRRFHNVNQDTYFAIIEGYARRFGIDLLKEPLEAS